MKSMRPVVISAVALGLAVASPVLWVQSAKGQAAETSASQRGSSIADVLRDLESRSRDSHSTFNTTIRNDSNLDIGRSFMFLEGELPVGILGDTFTLDVQVADEMDIRSVTVNGNRCYVRLFIVNDYAIGDPDSFQRLDTIYTANEDEVMRTYYPDPPIRLEEGDLILVALDRSDGTGNAFGNVTIRGTVPAPSAGSGDLLRVE